MHGVISIEPKRVEDLAPLHILCVVQLKDGVFPNKVPPINLIFKPIEVQEEPVFFDKLPACEYFDARFEVYGSLEDVFKSLSNETPVVLSDFEVENSVEVEEF